MNAEKIANIRARLFATSTWPWTISEDSPQAVTMRYLPHVAAIAHMGTPGNAAFVVTVREEVAWLLDLVERQAAAIEQARELLCQKEREELDPLRKNVFWNRLRLIDELLGMLSVKDT